MSSGTERSPDQRPPSTAEKTRGPRDSSTVPAEYLTRRRRAVYYSARTRGSPSPLLLPRACLLPPPDSFFLFPRCCKILPFSCWRGPGPEDSNPYPPRTSRLASATRSAPPLHTSLDLAPPDFSDPPDSSISSLPSACAAPGRVLLPSFLSHHSFVTATSFEREGYPITGRPTGERDFGVTTESQSYTQKLFSATTSTIILPFAGTESILWR